MASIYHFRSDLSIIFFYFSLQICFGASRQKSSSLAAKNPAGIAAYAAIPTGLYSSAYSTLPSISEQYDQKPNHQQGAYQRA